MTIDIEKWNETRDGPLTEKTFTNKLEERGYRVSRYTYPPGTTFPDHAHGVEKIDAVLSGQFRITMGGEEVVLEAGDAIRVPQGSVHSAEVVGDEPVVSLDAVRM